MRSAQQILAGYGAAASGAAYSRWNFSDRSGYIGGTLNTANMGTDALAGQIRSTVSKTSGKWYWECTVLTSTTNITCGVADSFASTTTYTGQETRSAGYSANGQIISNGTVLANVATYTVGDVLGFALDLSALTIAVYKNNALQYARSLGASTWFAACGQMGGSTGSVVANFGATALTYTPPAGFNAGLYN